MDTLDLQLQQLLEAEIESLDLQDTPQSALKPDRIAKDERLIALREFLALSELKEQLQAAQEISLNLLPRYHSFEEFSKIKEQITGSPAHFAHFVESLEDHDQTRPILLQEMFGFSDETLLHIYALASRLILEGNFKEANTLLVFLTTLAPHVASYWIAEGICLQALGRHLEALAVFKAASALNESNPAPTAYSIESYLALNEKGNAKEELAKLRLLMDNYLGNDAPIWQDRVNYFSESGM